MKKKILSSLLALVLVVAMSFSTVPSEVFAESTSWGLPIIYENGLHYIEDPAFPGERITLFCMNNQLNWPHHTDEMGEIKVPNYTEGYLEPEDFESQRDYEECMRRLSKLLYAGYPYNAENLYKIVEDAVNYSPTVEQFNEMLVTPPILQTAFPFLGHHEFTYADWQNQDKDSSAKQHMDELKMFVDEVAKLNPNDTTPNGLTHSDITAMPFYKAAYCMVWDKRISPLETFSQLYGTSYFVTEKQAYDATQDAIWKLLTEYKIPDNNITDLNHSPLGKVLYLYSERSGVLDHKPLSDNIQLKGDLKFTYNAKDGMWHSGKLMIKEPVEYNGLYKLKLPKGWSAKCEHLTYVYGNEEYELVADHQPSENEAFGVEANFKWMQALRQYSPTSDVEVNGKKFQHMIGAVIKDEKIHLKYAVDHVDVGDLRITKTVANDENNQEEFNFKVELSNYKQLNGLYGDLEFHNGVAEFTLKNGQTVTGKNLPAGAEYKVTEQDTGKYQISSTNAEGIIAADKMIDVGFTNTKIRTAYNLLISKEVTGNAGDKTKEFKFKIELKDEKGNAVNGVYDYVGNKKSGKLTFLNGIADITLSHGEEISIQNLPINVNYTVTEYDANKNGYTTTYNGLKEAATGVMDKDKEVRVVNHKESIPFTEIGKGNGGTHHGQGNYGQGNTIKTGNESNMTVYGIAGMGAALAIALSAWFRKRYH